ncbi:MAG: DUF5947 family protein [Sciscionella sp.]
MTSGLRRFLTAEDVGPQAPAVPCCEMCGEPLGSTHGHIVDIENRSILCGCRACYLLFTSDGSGGHRFAAIPERYRHDPHFAMDQSTWDSIGIPVRMAFFFHNSQLGTMAAFYPSPAGATESLLPLEEWQQVVADNPEFAETAPDVEAMLVNRTDDGFECFGVPIDACYRLVGLVKLNWRGFDGGSEAWQRIDGFFDELRQRSKTVGGHDG